MKKLIARITSALVATALAGVVCLFVFAHSMPQQEGDQRIIANAEAEVGELLRLEIQTQADDYHWLVVPSSPDFEIYAEGRKAVFSAREPGEYLFIAAYCVNNKVSLLRHSLKVKGPPEPIVPPGPDASVLKLIPYWCHTLEIPEESRAVLAKNFKSISEAATSGKFETVQELIAATAEVNRTVDPKLKELLDKISSYIVKQAGAGQLETVDQHILLWNKIALALKK